MVTAGIRSGMIHWDPAGVGRRAPAGGPPHWTRNRPPAHPLATRRELAETQSPEQHALRAASALWHSFLCVHHSAIERDIQADRQTGERQDTGIFTTYKRETALDGEGHGQWHEICLADEQ